MSQSQGNSIRFAKIITVLAIAFGVGLGLCGLNWALLSTGVFYGDEEFGAAGFGLISLAVMILSAFGLVITVIIWLIIEAFGSPSFELGGGDTIRLFDNKDDGDRKNSS